MSTIMNARLKTVLVRITSAWCIYEFPTIMFKAYIFVFTTRFLMLFLFLMIAHMFVFANIFLIFSVLNKIFFSSSNILLICFCISRTEPGKMQHILSASFLL